MATKDGMETYRAFLAARDVAEQLLLSDGRSRYGDDTGSYNLGQARKAFAELTERMAALEPVKLVEAA